MPSELRIIRFSYHELKQSLVLYGSRLGVAFGEGEILGASNEKTGSKDITLVIKKRADSQEYKSSYSTNIIAACLMRLCQEQGIPLPSRAVKSLKLGQSDIILSFRISDQVAL